MRQLRALYALLVIALCAGPAFAETLTVGIVGSGTGKIVGTASSATVIDCNPDCEETLPSGQVVTLSAGSVAGSVFRGWVGGGCTGTAPCQVTMDADKFVFGRFDAPSSATTADLVVAQSFAPNPASVGKDFVITMTVTNNGPATATGVAVEGPISGTYVWSSPGCVKDADVIECGVSSLASGASIAFRLVVRPDAAGSLFALAEVVANEVDSNTTNNRVTAMVPVNSTPAGVPVLRYRLYSPVTLEHHFTTDLNEYTVLGAQGGWEQEGTVGKVLNNPGTFNGVTAVPYYRLYNDFNHWHHWTTDANEYYTLVTFPGWNGEGVDGYILPTNTAGAMQLYRLVYPNGTGLHHWTVDANEYTTLIATYGWVGEGGAGFVVQ